MEGLVCVGELIRNDMIKIYCVYTESIKNINKNILSIQYFKFIVYKISSYRILLSQVLFSSLLVLLENVHFSQSSDHGSQFPFPYNPQSPDMDIVRPIISLYLLGRCNVYNLNR